MRKQVIVLCLAMLVTVSLTGIAAAALTTSFSMDGPLGAEVAAFAIAGGMSGSGTLNLNTIPAGASIVQATLYGNNYFGPLTPSAEFAGTSLGTTSAFAIDGGFSAYKWDVTSLVTGSGAYTASFSGMSNSYGLALAVVFSDASLPLSRVSINDGAIDVLDGTVSTTFSAFAGPGTLWLHTLADNNGFGESGEQILFNGAVIGGPIDANLGPYASLFKLPVTAVSGINTAAIFDPESDNFGWDLAVLTTPTAVIPLPGGLILLGSGLMCLAALRNKFNR